MTYSRQLARFAEGGELDGLSAPALVDDSPLLIVELEESVMDRSTWAVPPASALGSTGPGMTGNSESPRSTSPSP